MVPFLSGKVEYDGRFSIEGAKEVLPSLTRYVTRALKLWEEGLVPWGTGAAGLEEVAWARQRAAAGRVATLAVAPEGERLVAK